MNNLTMKHLARAMAALIVERRTYEYYGPDLAQRMSLEEMRAKREEIDEAIDALKEAALALAAHAQPQAAGGVVADWSRADDWAQWGAVDANGYLHWHEDEPYLGYDEASCHWFNHGNMNFAYVVKIPIGVDWRLLKFKCPQAQD